MENNSNNENKKIGILIILIILVIAIAGIILVINKDKKIEVKNKDIENIILKYETAIIYVENSDAKKCDKCKEIKNYLDKKNIDYILYDINKYSKNEYDKMLNLLSINPNDFGYPGIVYIKEGSLYSNVININNTIAVDNFIKDYNLTQVKSDKKK